MKALKYLLAACVVFAPVVSHADQVITFEGYPGDTVFTTQFPGVDFNGATVLSETDGTLNFAEFPPHSGVNVVYNPSGPMTVDFSTPVQYFSGYYTYNEPLVVTAYDGSTVVDIVDGACVANYVGSGCGTPNELDEVSAADITSVVIAGGGGDNFTLDDAEFTGSVNSTSTTPEPSSLVLLGTGILGMAGAARRRLLKK